MSWLRNSLEFIGRFMGRLWLTLLYFSVVMPFGLLARMRAPRQRLGEPAWILRREPDGINTVRRQY